MSSVAITVFSDRQPRLRPMPAAHAAAKDCDTAAAVSARATGRA